MERKYFFLFKLPIERDWAFYVWAVLTIAGSEGGDELGASAIGSYLFSLIWLLPRRIFIRSSPVRSSNKFGGNSFTVNPLTPTQTKSAEGSPGYLESNENLSEAIVLRRGGYQEVVGESNYVASFKHISRGDKSGEINTLATLRREPNNKFDKNAIAVLIQGKTFGYIPREDNKDWQPVISRIESQGKSALVSARVWWDFSANEDDGPFGSVTLDVVEPQYSIIVNEPPSGETLNLTGDRAYQLSDESKFLENIEPFLDKGTHTNSAAVIAELKLNVSENNSGKEYVQILIDEQEVGSLSNVTGAKFIPILKRCENLNLSFIAEAEISGNALAAEIKIYLTLPENFSKEMVTRIKSFENGSQNNN